MAVEPLELRAYGRAQGETDVLFTMYDTWAANDRPRDANGAPRVTGYSRIQLKCMEFDHFVEAVEMRKYAKDNPPSDAGPARVRLY